MWHLQTGARLSRTTTTIFVEVLGLQHVCLGQYMFVYM